MQLIANPQSSDDAGLSFSRTLLENVHDHQLSIDEMAFLAGNLFEAGSDTVERFPCFPTNGLSRNL